MNLKKELQSRLLDDMIKPVKQKEECVVLVVDMHTSTILSSCCRMYDVMEAGVLALENIKKQRERLDMAAIYFLSPTEDSVDGLIKDFSNAKKPQYTTAHLFFTSRVKSDLMRKIAGCQALVTRLKTLQEMNCDFVAYEERVFTFSRTEKVLSNLYFPASQAELSAELEKTSWQIVSLLMSLHEYPHIRYSNKGKSGPICLGLAKFVEDDMRQTMMKLKDWKPNESRERGTLLIVDRSMDSVCPLMHEYTYQAMVQDLLHVKGELCYLTPTDDDEKKDNKDTAAAAAKKEDDDIPTAHVLSEDDALWVEFRHNHIGKVISDVAAKFREFKGTSKLAKLQSNDAASVKEMIQAMKEMPKYKDLMKKYHKHMSIASECMSKFEAKQLNKLGELEQDMATGLTNDGKEVVMKTLKTMLVEMCQSPNIGVMEKLRLLMIYVISQGGIQESTRKELMKNIDTQLQKAIRNLEKLGVDLATQMKKGTSKHSRERMAEFEKRARTIPLALMRYLPVLYNVFQNLVNYQLSEDEFPYIVPPADKQEAGKRQAKSARRQTGGNRNWRNNDDQKQEDTRPYFIIFVLGGLTFSEMRSVYEIAEQTKAQVIIGSTSTLTAKGFIKELADLSSRDFNNALKASGGTGGPSNAHGDDSDSEDEDKKDKRASAAGGKPDGDKKLSIKFDN